MDDHTDTIERLTGENKKLRAALVGLIRWAGESPDGPPWATPEVKRENREAYERALEAACSCFPEESFIHLDGTSEPLWPRTGG